MSKKLISIVLVFTLLLGLFATNGFWAFGAGLEHAGKVAEEKESKIVKEDVSLRGEFEKHFVCEDGSYIAASYQEPVCYLDDNGQWIDIDNSLTENNGRIENQKAALKVSFSKDANDEELVKITHDNKQMSWNLSFIETNTVNRMDDNAESDDSALQGLTAFDVHETDAAETELKAESSKAVIDKKTRTDESVSEAEKMLLCDSIVAGISYPSLFRHSVEAKYTVFPNRIKENIVINDKTSLSGYSMNVKCNGLVPVITESNEVHFVDETGKVSYCLQTPYMYDDLYELSYDIRISVSETKEGYKITFYPDLDWLNSDDRIYPITIDPSITTGTVKANFSDTYIYQGDSASSTRCLEEKMRVGIYNGNVHRVFWKALVLPTISSAANITAAKFVVKLPDATTTSRNFNIYRVNSNWSSNTITWSLASNFSYTKLQSDVSRITSSNKVRFNGTKLTNAVKGWYSNGNNHGFVIRYTDESKTNPDYNLFYSSDNTTSTSYMPTLTITYEFPGNTPGYESFSGILTENITINGISLPIGTPMRHGLRYISQEGAPGYSGNRIDTVNFRSEYWGSYSSYQGCAVASTSVALFTLGINKLPKDICAINAQYGNPVSMQWSHVASAYGCSYDDVYTTNIDTYLNKYINNPMVYAAPIVKINKSYSHFVTIVAKNSDGTYKALDPSSHTVVNYNDGCTRVLQYYIP